MTNRTWFITGINRGLGRELAEALLERGDRVACTARRVTDLGNIQAMYGERLWTAALDLTDADAIRGVVDRAFAELGRIDVVVDNAGSSLVGAVEECTDEMIRRILDTNLLGSILVVKAALPHLRAQGGGRILQVSSSLGQFAIPGIALYVASKWGIEGFIESTAQDVAPFGIEATIFEPGSIRTDFPAAAVLSPPLAAYDGTPARGMRGRVESARGDQAKPSTSPGDPAKMARTMSIRSTNPRPRSGWQWGRTPTGSSVPRTEIVPHRSNPNGRSQPRRTSKPGSPRDRPGNGRFASTAWYWHDLEPIDPQPSARSTGR